MIKPIPLHKEPIKHVVVTLVTSQHLMTAKEDKLNIPEANDPTQAKDKEVSDYINYLYLCHLIDVYRSTFPCRPITTANIPM